jgi:hypothetical protein
MDSLQIDTIKYFYDSNGYLIKMENNWNNYYALNFNYIDSNLSDFEYITFTYYDTLNKIDLFNLGYCDGIAGKINKNIMKHIKWGANGGPSTYASESDYKYTLDKNGYIIEMIETFYPSHYYTTTLQDKDLKHYRTRYKYNNYVP